MPCHAHITAWWLDKYPVPCPALLKCIVHNTISRRHHALKKLLRNDQLQCWLDNACTVVNVWNADIVTIRSTCNSHNQGLRLPSHLAEGSVVHVWHRGADSICAPDVEGIIYIPPEPQAQHMMSWLGSSVQGEVDLAHTNRLLAAILTPGALA